jgi:hypothetical protein
VAINEIRFLVFTVMRTDITYQGLTGATASDPRVFWQYTPLKIEISDLKPGYSVYYRSGTIRSNDRVLIGGRDDQVFTVEIYGKTPALCDDIGDCLEELWRDKQYETETYVALHTFATIGGSPYFDDGRNLFTHAVNIHIDKVIVK